ncbi:hypothetical protein HYH02_014796 [Chlamydomonas schloesseri]|uniref:Mitochondrial carrier protein n=1 Tax=Chlamydomonas schloesseri TaxID=2026947 RepID=A0A835SMW9_9CHLO|nr:hypothetical protein HYH02_014796 [Chlamydomonas schloesseri]|eukprot:KAG2426438.1 hypothetical protein HYH02_014796 [Chlamydomonas schloesseri]
MHGGASQEALSTPAAISPAARELFAGFGAGAANVVSGYPFDTVKVRLQSAAPGTYRGALDCAVKVVQREGLRRGLFRGLSSPLVGGTLETGVNYLVYSRVLDALRASSLAASAAAGGGGVGGGGVGGADTPGCTPLGHVAAAGAVAGVALSFILGPTELVKCRMQLAGSSARYPGGPLQVLREVVAAEGWARGLTRGLGATMAREVPGNAVFFTVYEVARRSLRAPQDTPGSRGGGVNVSEAVTAVLSGGVAGTLMWALVLPIDVAKTRLQAASPGTPWDVGLLRQWAMLWREGGVRSLYAGLTPTLVRAFPANACQWLAWEAIMRSPGA